MDMDTTTLAHEHSIIHTFTNGIQASNPNRTR